MQRLDIEKIALEMKKETGIRPFSNGSEREGWKAGTCEQCQQSYETRFSKQPPNFEKTVYLCKRQLECAGCFAVDFSAGTGFIPSAVSVWMGGTETDFPTKCKHFLKAKKEADGTFSKEQPAPIDPNQIALF